MYFCTSLGTELVLLPDALNAVGVQQLLAAAAAASNNPGKLVVVGKGTGSLPCAGICWQDTPVHHRILIDWLMT